MDMRPLNALGPLSDLTVPQKWFWHFYAIGAITNALIILILSSSLGYTTILDNAATAAAGGRGSMPIAILVLWQVHLIRRLIETIALLKYPPNARMHIIAYVFALAYYVVVSMTLLPPTAVEKLAAFVFRGQSATVFTSGISSGTIGKVKQLTAAAVLYHFTLMRRFGIAVFVAGSLIQLHSHILLRQLADKNPSTRRSSAVTTPRRKTRSSSGGALEQEMKTESGSGGSKQQYKIPKGGMFELVSCPHYFGEIVIYVGLVLVTEMHNWGAWLMLAWVVRALVCCFLSNIVAAL